MGIFEVFMLIKGEEIRKRGKKLDFYLLEWYNLYKFTLFLSICIIYIVESICK
jgi:hypothetical protein